MKRVRLCGLFSPVDLLSSHPSSLSVCLRPVTLSPSCLSPRPPCSVVFSCPSFPVIFLSHHLAKNILQTFQRQLTLLLLPLTAALVLSGRLQRRFSRPLTRLIFSFRWRRHDVSDRKWLLPPLINDIFLQLCSSNGNLCLSQTDFIKNL